MYQWPEWRRGRLAPYSVAQHSVLVYELVTEWLHGGEQSEEDCLSRRAALLHDGHEVYPPGDQLSPVLRHPCSMTDAIRAMSRAAAGAFRVAVKIPLVIPEIVKRADAAMLATEKRDLYPPDLPEWGDNGRILPPPRERRIDIWEPEQARDAFFRRLASVAPDLWPAAS